MWNQVKGIITSYYVKAIFYTMGLGLSFNKLTDFKYGLFLDSGEDYRILLLFHLKHPLLWLKLINGYALAFSILFFLLLIKTIKEGERK